jgi:hypothetical protein
MLIPRKLLSFALILLALGSLAHAQQQEQSFMDRLKRKPVTTDGSDLQGRLSRGPNSNLTYDTSQSAFGSRSVSTSKIAKTGDFNTRSFVSHEFISKPYGGTEKRSWFASLLFPAKSASTSGKYEIPNAGQQYGTKDAPTKEARDAGKVAGTNAFAATDLQYLKRNRFDASIKAAPPQDKVLGYTGDLRPMTINDVRELLNKNK